MKSKVMIFRSIAKFLFELDDMMISVLDQLPVLAILNRPNIVKKYSAKGLRTDSLELVDIILRYQPCVSTELKMLTSCKRIELESMTRQQTHLLVSVGHVKMIFNSSKMA